MIFHITINTSHLHELIEIHQANPFDIQRSAKSINSMKSMRIASLHSIVLLELKIICNGINRTIFTPF
uniref:Uncharacterized protein n=1 Tax=Arundo donax TaxID=35708 RepID=A0A0A9G5L5_ARUDO